MLFGQKMLGRETIEAQRKSFDGLSALAMMIFLIPVFNGMGRDYRRSVAGLYFLLLAGDECHPDCDYGLRWGFVTSARWAM